MLRIAEQESNPSLNVHTGGGPASFSSSRSVACRSVSHHIRLQVNWMVTFVALFFFVVCGAVDAADVIVVVVVVIVVVVDLG